MSSGNPDPLWFVGGPTSGFPPDMASPVSNRHESGCNSTLVVFLSPLASRLSPLAYLFCLSHFNICAVRSRGYEIVTSEIVPSAAMTGVSSGITNPV